jgi:A/G-specific adenine glycosylase
MAGKQSAKAVAANLDARMSARLGRHLVSWYRAHCRDLPWRPTRTRRANPYHVLVSEMMLQQTQVATVIPFFHRFLATFPDVQTLAAADEQAVLRRWQGLGYYRRARHLHAAAQMIVARFGGRVPSTVNDLRQLPGVGRYTAGAIASIAFNVRAPILDGNVARVLARWFAVEQPVDAGATRDRLWELAAAMVGAPAAGRDDSLPTLKPSAEVGDFNQGLMELGALVCTPRAPRCLECPVRDDCQAHAQGLTAELPRKLGKKKPQPVTHHIVALGRADGRFRFVQRGHDGLWAGMWELPTYEPPEPPDDADGAFHQDASTAVGAWIKSHLGHPSNTSLREIGRFTHQTTHRTITFVLWTMHVRGNALTKGHAPRAAAGQTWRKLDEVDDLPLSNPQRRAVRMILTQAQRDPASVIE